MKTASARMSFLYIQLGGIEGRMPHEVKSNTRCVASGIRGESTQEESG